MKIQYILKSANHLINLQFKCYSVNIQQAVKYTTVVTDSFYYPITVNSELLRTEFENEFQGFKHYEIKLSMFTEPYTFDVDKADRDKQMEETEVQCDSLLKEKFSD